MLEITLLIAEPATISLLALAVSAVGVGVSTFGMVAQGNAAEDAAKRTQEAENANAQAAMQQAALEAGQIRRKNLLRVGEQRASAGKSGVLIDDSAADVIYDTSIQGELEAQSALYSGATQSSYYKNRGANARAEGRSAKSASRIQAGSTLLGGLASMAGRYAASKGTSNGRSALYNERGPQ